MKILVIGCGSIGRRHIRLLKEMGVEVEGFEANAQKAKEAGEATGVDIYHSTEPTPWLHLTLLSQFDGVIVATPNHLHARPAQAALCCGRPVLIEKPMTTTVHDAEVLISEAKAPILVGYNFRHNPALRQLKGILAEGTLGTVRHASIWCASYLPNWRPGTDYRQNYAAWPETGGGVLLDCSHELDYLLWLFGEPKSVSCITLNSGALDIAAEEAADLVIRFKSGVQANLHLSYLDHDYDRGCRIVGDHGTATMDLYPSRWSVSICPKNGLMFPKDWGSDSPDQMYRAELAHFLRVIEGKEQPLVTAEDGLMTLQVVEAARQSAAEGRVITL